MIPRFNPASKRLGILGGTFDPPHIGHLVLADQAREQLGLEVVLFCPAGQQPLKADQSTTPIHHRLAMTQLALAGRAGFDVSHVDIDRPGPHYTADTLSLLREQYANHELYFLMGADSLRDLFKWRDPHRIVALARLAVAPRPGVELNLPKLEESLPGLQEHIMWIDAPWLDIAASDIRRRVQHGLSIRYLVPPDVEAYIAQHKLYK